MLTTLAVIASTFVSNNWLLTKAPVPSSAECLRVAEDMLDQLKQEVGSPDLTTICLDIRPSFTSASELNELLLAYTPEAEAYQDINISVQLTRTITMAMTDGQIALVTN